MAVFLAYPILITLERPVRMTPEQAVRDYYGALSHHMPHFRRMWLLLSKAGRISSAFGSFEGFKNYWKDRLASVREGHAGSLTPLVFDVSEFQAEKSAAWFESMPISRSASRCAASVKRGRFRKFRSRSLWCAGRTRCGISRTEP